MSHATRFALLAAALAAPTACRKPPPPGGLAQVIAASPSKGDVDDDDLKDGVRVAFDRAAAPPEQIGRPLGGPALRLDPAVKGDTRWLDARTLAFFPAAKLEPSRAYTVTLAPDLATAPGVGLAPWKGLRFVHDRIRIESAGFPGGLREYQTTTPVLALRASQPLAPDVAAGACAFYEKRPDGTPGDKTRAQPANGPARDDTSSSEVDAPGGERAVRLRPADPLRPARAYLFRCGTDLKARSGGEGLAEPFVAPFSTYGPAAIKRIEPAGRDVSADGVKILVELATPTDPAEVRKKVTLSPAGGTPLAMALAADGHRTIFTWSGDLEPGTEYEIAVKSDLTDSFGQALGHEQRQTFRVGDASPRLSMDTGIFTVERTAGPARYPIFTRNLPAFHVACAAVPESRLAAVLTGPSNYDSWWEASAEQPLDYAALKLRRREKNVRAGNQKNRWLDAGIDLGAVCGDGRPGGLYLLEVATENEQNRDGSRRDRARRSLANVTDLGLLAKVGNGSSLIWVVRLSTGTPVAGASVKIRDLGGKVRFTGTTNADGVASAPGATKLIGVKPIGGATGATPGQAGDATSDEENAEASEQEWDDYRARRVIVTAQLAGDLAVLDTNWNNGVQIWNFGADADRKGGTVRVRGFLQSDRGLYRPGDTVHLRGLARVVDVAGKMTLPRRRRVHLVIQDPRGATVVEEDLPLSGFGGFHRDLPLDAEARLGDYRVRGEVEGQTFSDRFSVEEYRPRTFEVKVGAPKRNVFAGGKLTFDVTAAYLYGSPLRAGKVSWNLRRRDHLPQFPDFGDYVFQDFAAQGDLGHWWARDEQRSFTDAVADGEAELTAAGKARVTAQPETEPPTPQDYLFEATVEDPSGQGVTTGQVVTVHRANLYLGLHPAEFVQAVDMPFAVQLVGFDADGKRRPADAELTLTRRTYDCGTHAGETWWSCKRGDAAQPDIKRAVAVPEAGSAAVERVVLKEPGEYLVRVTAPDGRGGRAISSDVIYVIGKGEAFWSGDEGDRMTLVASKPRYRPGDTARLIPQAQMPGALSLLTLERDGIISYALKRLESTGDALEVPIEPRLAPDVYASVVLVRGRTGAGDPGRPRFKMGMVKLEVDASDRRLSIDVQTERPSYRPGEAVSARVKVTAADGTPVRAELALAVADEGVLQIAGFKTPDPMPAFYAPWGLGVETSTTWNRLLRAHNPDAGGDDDESGGDAGGDEAGRIQSRFMATAFWAPALVTGADGTAAVHFTAPDNLTAFRVMAVAADAGDRFGAGERRFTVAKPLQAMPALPRFLSVGDEIKAAVVIHNNTARAMDVQVRLAAAGKASAATVAIDGPAARSVKVAAGAAQPAIFAVKAIKDGPAVLTFRAQESGGGGESDAVEIRMPVQTPSAHDTVAVAEGTTSDRVQQPIPALGDIVPGRGRMEVVLDTTGLSRLDESLSYLVGYPYGCLEQTTSRVVPMIALGELARTVDLPGVNTSKARGYVQTGIAKILRHQHDDGGFGLWIGAPAETHYTAVALWGLGIAKAAGYAVDDRALEQGAGYLKRRVGEPPDAGHGGSEIAGVEGARAFAHYVLASLGKADAPGLAQLFERRAQLPIFGRAFLARGLAAAHLDEQARTMAGELAALAGGGAGPFIIKEEQRDLDWYWSSDARTTALALQALLEIAPEDPATQRLADGLLAARTDGRWRNTQENLHALLALAAVAKTRAAAGDVTVTVSAGGKERARRTISGGAIERVRLPLGDLDGGPLVIAASGGRLFYAARIDVERPLGAAAVDRGLRIERAYLDPDSGAPVGKISLGQTVKVRLTIRSPERRAHVAVVDRLPAGFEPVLTRFRRSYTEEEQQPRRSFWWWGAPVTAWQNEELRDDRAQLFADALAPGESTHEYLVRATTAGTFDAPPALAEAMYSPEVNGRSAAARVVIER